VESSRRRMAARRGERFSIGTIRPGITDLVLDPNNPEIIYAAFWQAWRTPWQLVSGGGGSGIFKSTDGGEHWNELTRNPGLPQGVIGNIGLASHRAIRTKSGRSSRRIRAECIARPMEEQTGRERTATGACDSARGTTRESLPIPRTRIPFTCSTPACTVDRQWKDLPRHLGSARRQPRSLGSAERCTAHDRVE